MLVAESSSAGFMCAISLAKVIRLGKQVYMDDAVWST